MTRGLLSFHHPSSQDSSWSSTFSETHHLLALSYLLALLPPAMSTLLLQRRSSGTSFHSRSSARDSQRVADSRPASPTNADAAPKLAAHGIHAAPPTDIVPPGSSLDVIDISSPSTRIVGHSSAEAEVEERPSGMEAEASLEEIDITVGESAWADGAEEEDASKTSKPVRRPSRDGELRATTSQLDVPEGEATSRLSPDHPLRQDRIQQTQNRSPPPWEVVQPPEMNNSHRPAIVHEFGVKLYVNFILDLIFY